MTLEDLETLERQVRPWLEKSGISLDEYRNLPSTYKVWLGDQLYGRTRLSLAQKRTLYRKLRPLTGRVSPDPMELITNELLQKSFSPLKASEKLHDLDKF